MKICISRAFRKHSIKSMLKVHQFKEKSKKTAFLKKNQKIFRLTKAQEMLQFAWGLWQFEFSRDFKTLFKIDFETENHCLCFSNKVKISSVLMARFACIWKHIIDQVDTLKLISDLFAWRLRSSNRVFYDFQELSKSRSGLQWY